MSKPVRHRSRWRIRWIDENGARCSEVFDSFREAEHQLRQHVVAVEEIKRGARAPTPPTKTCGELFDYWLLHRAPEKRSVDDDRSMIRKHLRPAFGHVLLRDLQTEATDDYIAARKNLAAHTVANHLTLLATMVRVAVEELKWLHAAPKIRKPRPNPDDDIDQPWLKNASDIHRVLEAASAEIDRADPLSEVPYVCYFTAVHTGLRAGEIAGLQWIDVDLERRTIHVRRSYDGKTKTRGSRRFVPIVDALLPVLRAWKLRCPPTQTKLVFPNTAGNMFDESARIFQEVLHRVLDRAGFERPTEGQYVHAIHFHSFRHTFACHWRLNGGPLEDLIRVLGHVEKPMTEYYANIGGYHRPEHFRIFPATSAASVLVPDIAANDE